MNLRKKSRDETQLHTSALNDILFILMFFFLIIATLFNNTVVKLSIPRASSDQKVKQSLVVSIDSNQQFYVGSKAVLADSLISRMSQELGKINDTLSTVVINADKQAQADQIVHVMRAARRLNLRTVLAVEPEGR
jgi:biopolymer transport protein ExbD